MSTPGMLTRWLLVVACSLPVAPALAVTVDDFAVHFPASGTYVTDASGSGGGIQSPIAVLGGTRDTRVVANDPANPTGATILANPSPPPITDVVHLVTGSPTGGALILHYPQTPAYDVTLGSLAPISSVLVVRSTLMLSGGTVQVSLEDGSGTSATDSLGTITLASEHSYQFFIGPNAFGGGLDLGNIEHIRVSVVRPTGVDSELSDVSLLPVASADVDWGKATTFFATGASGPENPVVLVGFNPQPEPPAALWDLSDPTRPTITFPAQPPEPVRIYMAFNPAFGINPCVAPDPGGFQFEITDAHTYRVVVEASQSDGSQLDPASLVGFNPQPEPPGSGMPFGYEWQTMSGGGGAGAGPAGPTTTTLSFQILDGGVPLSLRVASQVPGLPISGLVALAGALLAAGLVGAVGVRRARSHRLSIPPSPR